MKIAVLGATSQIAQDLVLSFAARAEHQLSLFARRPEAVGRWLAQAGLQGRYPALTFACFGQDEFDAVLNFVGVGDPAQAARMGAAILDVTHQFDELALAYVRQHPACRYIFLSSGAAYGANFDQPVGDNTPAVFPLNGFGAQDWYGVAKLHAECRHRSLAPLTVFDVRVFNYFSLSQDLSSRFLIADILRAVRERTVLKTAAAHIVRDYLHPDDFFQLITALLHAAPDNCALDAYSQAPIDKAQLLQLMQIEFGLRYDVEAGEEGVNATGVKPYYYSLSRRAAKFGYRPSFSSETGIVGQARALLAARAS